MQFFNSRHGGPSTPDFVYPGGTSSHPLSSWQALLNRLRREKRPGYLFGEIVLAVFLLHVLALHWLFAPSEPIAQAKPLVMEVSLVAAPKQEPHAAPPAPPKPPEPPKPKPKKKTVAKKKPVMKKPLPKEAVALPKPAEAEAEAEAAETPPTPPAPPAPAKSAAPPAETFTEANFRANYGFNPKPEYPRLARNRGWQGQVLLKVQVSAEGLSDTVDVYRSSGHDILDEAAAIAVKKWKFIPAMLGSTPVASAVIVPIIFTLNN
ncbi:energy transducer TonB [Methylomicrobium sp. RS1]|uniref:energy transducer TonB n=1 Tax=Candidatus Methylomicrobium oryzae TaxID=2802053 RepID=UPI0019214C34|nr:energy transducer TonB [Methylomicrobium sp. RS1]MBL1263897.1 energy transducer TonB [Methylomicrobium sp. RS1]